VSRISLGPGATRGPVVPPGHRTTTRYALVGDPDPSSSRATPWHGPHTAHGNSVVGRSPIETPAQAPPKATMFHGPHTADPPEKPHPPMRTFPVQETTKATMFHGPHTAEPGKEAGPRPMQSPPAKGSSRASMSHGPHTADTTRARAHDQASPDCKAPYQIGLPASTTGGTCVQYMEISTATSKVNCAGCPPSQPTQASSSSTTTAFVGFGGLFGPGPMIVS
jgi:hypothetical protein